MPIQTAVILEDWERNVPYVKSQERAYIAAARGII